MRYCEGFALSKLIKKTFNRQDLIIALVVGFMAILFNYGFVIGLIAGTVIHYALKKLNNESAFWGRKRIPYIITDPTVQAVWLVTTLSAPELGDQ